ncbi:ATP-binding region, ATPase-like protein [Beggiatoa sp. PS]|nr:ATP-binding region, ATPase-like protein [Beggiatoa sp. PS]
MSCLTWFDGNLCACLGGLLSYFNSQGLHISTKLSEINSGVLSFFKKNGFLTLFGQSRTVDTYGTTIEFKQHKINGSNDFQTYIGKSFSPGSLGLPNMTPRLLKDFRNSLYEIYLNAVEHAETQQDVFSCGQFFPRKQQLDFCITDLGIGIKENIKRKIALTLKPEEAIDWAMQPDNTTRKGESGGLGLKLIREFIVRNNGRIVIVSDAGYWELQGGQITKKCFDCPFPGTVVLIEVNTADTKSYALQSEIDPNDIF